MIFTRVTGLGCITGEQYDTSRFPSTMPNSTEVRPFLATQQELSAAPKELGPIRLELEFLPKYICIYIYNII